MCTMVFPCIFLLPTLSLTLPLQLSLHLPVPLPLHLYFYPFASPGSTTIIATIASIIEKAILSCAQLFFLAINKWYRTILQLTQPQVLMRALHNYYHYHNNLTSITSLHLPTTTATIASTRQLCPECQGSQSLPLQHVKTYKCISKYNQTSPFKGLVLGQVVEEGRCRLGEAGPRGCLELFSE